MAHGLLSPIDSFAVNGLLPLLGSLFLAGFLECDDSFSSFGFLWGRD